MGEQTRDKPPFARPPNDGLNSWKEIAAYLNRDVTTVQRWEKREGMPVRRHLHDSVSSVYAFRIDLDEWVRARTSIHTQSNTNREGALNSPDREGGKLQVLPPKSATRNSRKVVPLLATGLAVLAIAAGLWLQRTEYFWRSPLEGARFEVITDFDVVGRAAAISRDGRLVAFLSDRDGPIDVWLTQVGSGEFHNLTRGSVRELVNPSVRTLGFSPDSGLVTFWVREQDGSSTVKISIWAAPTLGGQARPYLEGVAELDWSPDGARLVYHTPEPGDPLYVSAAGQQPASHPIFKAPAGAHAHFPVWAPDGSFIYFVQGSLPDKLDIWRISPGGGATQRITSHGAAVTHPVLLDERTLLYLVGGSDGSEPLLYGMDLKRRIPHRLTSDLDRYTSLAASADGRHLVMTRSISKASLWRLRVGGPPGTASAPARIQLTTSTGRCPRYGPDYLLYLSATGASESIWKLTNGTAAELWSGQEARILGGPAVAPDGRSIAFSVRQSGRTLLYLMRADGTGARVVSDSLPLEGSIAWTPDGRSITSAVDVNGVPQLFSIAVSGGQGARLVKEFSRDPAWAPDGHLLAYSGPDIGTIFSVKTATPAGIPPSPLNLRLTRGVRRFKFLPGSRELVFLRGDIKHKDLGGLDLNTGVQRQLTNLAPDFDVRDFDVSGDGREVVLERSDEHSQVVLVSRAR